MKIVVLAGGTSTEREISIVSGTGICKALRERGHQAILVDVYCGNDTLDPATAFEGEYDVDALSYINTSFDYVQTTFILNLPKGICSQIFNTIFSIKNK